VNRAEKLQKNLEQKDDDAALHFFIFCLRSFCPDHRLRAFTSRLTPAARLSNYVGALN
jgi:hypothetical protein